MNYCRLFLKVMITVLLLSASVFAQDEEIPSADSFLKNHGLKKGSEVPSFVVESIDRNQINIGEYKGRFILIDFWGTWCKPCIKEAPFLKKAHKKFSDEIKFIGIAVDDKEEKIREFNDRFGIDWPQVMTKSD